MISMPTFRLLSYQSGRQSAPAPAAAPQPAPVVPAVAAPRPVAPAAIPAPVMASVSSVIGQIENQLAVVQQQAQQLIAMFKPQAAEVPTPAPAPAPAPEKPKQTAPKPEQPAPAKPKPAYGEPWKPGPGQLQGADTSHYQSDAEFQASIKGAQFSVIKASQGTGYVDPTFKQRWAELGKKVDSGEMKLRMAYVFLDSGNGAGQAKHFLDTVGVDGPLPAGTRLVIDWEGASLNSPQTLKDCADYIHKVTGLWPVIYVQGSKESVARSAVPDAPIWRAAWSSHIGTDVPFVQYSDGPNWDHDVFNGTVAALERFSGWA